MPLEIVELLVAINFLLDRAMDPKQWLYDGENLHDILSLLYADRQSCEDLGDSSRMDMICEFLSL
jgi:hypothetical protein